MMPEVQRILEYCREVWRLWLEWCRSGWEEDEISGKLNNIKTEWISIQTHNLKYNIFWLLQNLHLHLTLKKGWQTIAYLSNAMAKVR